VPHDFEKSEDKPWRDEDTLFHEYHVEDKTQQEIADEWGVSQPLIGKWVIKHDIQKRRTEPWHDEECLEKMYHGQGLSAREIAERLGTTSSTILSWMERFGIERRERSRAHQLSMWDGPATYELDSDGYARWKTTIDRETKSLYVHRLLAVAKYGFEAIKGMDVHHKNGVKWDNRSENIEIKSRREHSQQHAQETDGYIGKNLHLHNG